MPKKPGHEKRIWIISLSYKLSKKKNTFIAVAITSVYNTISINCVTKCQGGKNICFYFEECQNNDNVITCISYINFNVTFFYLAPLLVSLYFQNFLPVKAKTMAQWMGYDTLHVAQNVACLWNLRSYLWTGEAEPCELQGPMVVSMVLEIWKDLDPQQRSLVMWALGKALAKVSFLMKRFPLK